MNCEKHPDREGFLSIDLPSIGIKTYWCRECQDAYDERYPSKGFGRVFEVDDYANYMIKKDKERWWNYSETRWDSILHSDRKSGQTFPANRIGGYLDKYKRGK